MKEKGREKTSCYTQCPIKHDCLGGYFQEVYLCDDEIERIKNKLSSQYPNSQVLFAPKNIEGLRFKVISPNTKPEKVYKLENGEIISPDSR